MEPNRPQVSMYKTLLKSSTQSLSFLACVIQDVTTYLSPFSGDYGDLNTYKTILSTVPGPRVNTQITKR